MKKFASFVLCLALALTLLAAPAALAEEPVTITFVSHIYKPWNDMLTQQVEEFMAANPNVTIEYTTYEHADLNIKLTTALAANEAPTIMGIYGPWMPALIENGWLDPAPDYVKEDIAQNCFPIAGQSAEFDGETYGYIQHIGINTAVVNPDFWADNGVEIPTTWEDLAAASETLNIVSNGIPMQTAGALNPTKDGSWNVIHWASILACYGGSLLNEDGTAAAFNSEEGRISLELYDKLTFAGYKPSDNFIQGYNGLCYAGPFDRSSYIENNPDLNFEAREPLSGPAGQITTMYAWFWCVAADATDAQKEAAWKFLNYISSDEKYLEMATAIGFLSFRTANYEDETYANDPWFVAYGKALENAQLYYAKTSHWEEIDMAIGTELERLVADEITVEECLANAEEAVNKILAK